MPSVMSFDPSDEADVVGLLKDYEANPSSEESHNKKQEEVERYNPGARKTKAAAQLTLLTFLHCIGLVALALGLLVVFRGCPQSVDKKLPVLFNEATQNTHLDSSAPMLPPPVPDETSHLIEYMRLELATISIELMQQDTAEAAIQSQMFDISPLCDLLDRALDMIGVYGVFQSLFRSPDFAVALNKVAPGKGLKDFEAKYVFEEDLQPYIPIDGIPNDRSYLYLHETMCTGCAWWLWHYAGAITAEKIFRDGDVSLYGGGVKPDIKFEDGSSFMKELQTIQRRNNSDIMAFHATHGFLWHLMIRELSDLDAYPIEIAFASCGELLWKEEYIEHVHNDLARECRHGVGHGIYYFLAIKEMMGAEAYSVHKQVRPGTFKLSDASLCKAYDICKSAPHDLSYRECIGGVRHSHKILGWEGKKQKSTRGQKIMCTKWFELPTSIQVAAKTLGYNKESWDNHDKPSDFDQKWTVLKPEKQKAAKMLGYGNETWSFYYDDYDWDDLPIEVQGAANIMGYINTTWEKDDKPFEFEQEWKDLTARQKEAAKRLGYDEQRWHS